MNFSPGHTPLNDSSSQSKNLELKNTKALRMKMIGKADQYRGYGEQALASAEKTFSKKEKAELLQIADTWFELAEQRDDHTAVVVGGTFLFI